MPFFSNKTSKLSQMLTPCVSALSHTLSASPTPTEPPLTVEQKSYHNLLDRLHVPINKTPSDQVECDAAQDEGQYYARQDMWETLATRIREADHARETTHAGLSIADLLAYGARADVVQAAEHSLLHGKAARKSNFFSGVEALEEVLLDNPDSYPLALVVAHMHIDIGWAWRGSRSEEDVSDLNREAFEAHFDRAADIVSEFSTKVPESPALSAARCALLPGRINPELHLVREFDQLIDLDPFNSRHMRALGNYLLPRWYGDFQALDLEARRTAARTYEDWGAGAYTWVWFDALLVDPAGFDALEIDYFLDGILDILERRRDQHTANLLAAHLFQSWQICRARHEDSGTRPDLPPALRRGYEHIITHHLREVHPLIWGHAEIGFENTARVISAERLAEKGQQTALKALALPFLNCLQDGKTITFGPDGISQSRP